MPQFIPSVFLCFAFLFILYKLFALSTPVLTRLRGIKKIFRSYENLRVQNPAESEENLWYQCALAYLKNKGVSDLEAEREAKEVSSCGRDYSERLDVPQSDKEKAKELARRILISREISGDTRLRLKETEKIYHFVEIAARNYFKNTKRKR